MMYYARSDTHYLLYIYDRMRNEILSKGDPITRNLLNVTLSRSAETALKVYEKDVYDTEGGSGSTGWKNTLRKYNRPMNVQQFAVYQAIHAWRDTTAREADESIHYVLPNHMLFNLVEVMPNNAQQALACCSPTPTFVRLYANELVALIDHARVETLRNEQVKQVELNKLKEAMEAKERDWEKRKREGPMHVRFDASAEREDSQAPPAPKKIKAVEGSDVSTASTASFPKTVISVPGSQKTISGKERTSSRVQVAAQNSSSLLGSKWNKETLPSKWEEAQAIKDSMMLEAPDSHSILETLHSVMEIPAIKEKEEGEVDTSIPMQTDDSQSQESLEDVADDDEFSAKSEDEPALKSKTLVINDDSFEVVANVRQKKKKKKGKKNKGLVASLKSSGEVEVAEEAFDFKTAKSSVAQFLETVKEQTSWNK